MVITNIIIDLTSGFIAEAVSCCIWVPIDVCKEQLQTQKELALTKYKGNNRIMIDYYDGDYYY